MKKDRYELTEAEHGIITTATEILARNFDVTNCNDNCVFFQLDGEDIEEEYNVCENPDCIEKMKNQLTEMQKNGDFEAGEFEENYLCDFSDKSSIEYCAICYKPFNSFLTWISDEFIFFNENRKSKKIVTENYFQLYTIFQSMPSYDYSRRPNYKEERKLFKNVVRWAEYVIKILTKN
jgi:hypothetical protein